MAVHVVLVHIQIGGVEAGAQVQLLGGRQRLVQWREVLVQGEGCPHAVGGLVELDQHAVAQALDQATPARGQHLRGGVVHEPAPLVHHRGFVGRHEPHRLHQVDHQHDLVPLLWQRRHGRRWWVLAFLKFRSGHGLAGGHA
ncbi:hypothetical protein ACFJGX_14890 [Hydrogenophaga sp. UC242_50]|uniref:hypothetical protein n=1 Tax=Hydrogenophaga sp. UC242_50 TaxID=3350169 RepID=UPI0036D29434